MANRPIIYNLAQTRDYDVLHGWRESLNALGQLAGDVLGSTSSVVSGLGATSNNNMTISLAAGEIYALTDVDTTAYGSLTSDTSQTMQQGYALAQSVILNTTGINSGQSRYTLIYATFSQTDVIPSDDPNGGVLNYLNSTNPSGPPWSGPSNSGAPQNTRRTGVCTISTVTGSAATTGTEVPPNVPGGAVALYLVDLAFGQSTIGQSQILPAGPSGGTNVPSNYSGPSFLAGLVQKPTIGTFAGNPNGNMPGTVMGTPGSPAWPNLIWDTTNKLLWTCVTSGSATNAVWQQAAAGVGQFFNVAQFQTATRVSLVGNSGNSWTTTAWSPGTYTKQSATSKLVVWLNAFTFCAGATAPAGITLTVGAQTFPSMAVNNFSGTNTGATTLINVFSGLAAGAQSVTLKYSRNDSVDWTDVFCPTNSDAAYLASTNPSVLILAELGA